VKMQRVTTAAGQAQLRRLVQSHVVRLLGSLRAIILFDSFE
jgi:hypothetical protein